MNDTKKMEQKVCQEEPNIKEQLEHAVKRNTENFYKDILVKADEKIKMLEKQVSILSDQQLGLRDEVALQCYSVLITQNSDYPQAARDSFTAADAFMRYRETGEELEPALESLSK